jgi:hypothetical protein
MPDSQIVRVYEELKTEEDSRVWRFSAFRAALDQIADHGTIEDLKELIEYSLDDFRREV